MRKLSVEEMKSIDGGELITLSAVMAILVTAIVAVIVYKLFISSKGSTTIPGGFKFSWGN